MKSSPAWPVATMTGEARTPSWQECFDAGMTAPEAAAMRGRALNCAYAWSARNSLTWPKPPNPNRMPVTIRGVTYASQDEAARILKVSASRISHHLTKYGHADLVGLKKAGGQVGHIPPHLENPVIIGTRRWRSRKALAQYIGWNPNRVCRALGKESNSRLLDNLLAAIMAADAKREASPNHGRASQRAQRMEGIPL